MFQMAGVGPMFGQRGHFVRAAPEKIPYAIERYTNESRRLLNVIEQAAGRGAIPRRRLLDRRHGDVSVGGRYAARAGARWRAGRISRDGSMRYRSVRR